ncbi:hypothetical protein BO83DRAFT_453014 [Aspergillus eucalypticola CBS 122712]|uniref:Uncharacterized protein n=1 Tax=Aspergillus eucalypticola (strain CBS 122712 / IBT 29274) TaxID=1448314 RepID=A0A317UXZ4_ASPEC|nr:uncharacterized protein BO83DRAFT_453014 [Aspergillus eucalypticola CBS 122712]PWY65387.1 hypothetical protein BO83DRAFT_453014 [Aspergillus eucalypticola CBS 122712]
MAPEPGKSGRTNCCKGILQFPKEFSIGVTSGPSTVGSTELYELNFARRALRLVKERLGIAHIEKLLQPDIEEGNAFWQAIIAKNTTGQFKPSCINMSVNGLSPDEFVKRFHLRCAKRIPDMLAAEPEHWVVTSDAENNQMAIKNLGPWITRLYIKFGPPSMPWQQKDLREDFPFRICGHAESDEGVPLAYILHQLKPHNVGVGFDARFCIYFPASAPDEIFEQHRQHLLVEFTNWTRHCYTELKEDNVQV